MTCNKKQRRKTLKKSLGFQLSVFASSQASYRRQPKAWERASSKRRGGFSLFFLIFSNCFFLFPFRFFNSPILRLHEISSINLGMQRPAINTEAQRRGEIGSSPDLKKRFTSPRGSRKPLITILHLDKGGGGKSKRVTETKTKRTLGKKS